MTTHPDTFMARALAEHRKRTRDAESLQTSFEQINGFEFVAVRDRGAAVSVYQVQRDRLRRARQVPDSIW